MRVAIYACEGMYGGLHGIADYWIGEVNDLKEAEAIGQEMSYDLASSYECIYNSYKEDAENEGLEPYTEEFYEYIEECIRENIEYEIYTIKDTDKSDEELCEMFYNDKEDFIENYCEEI